MSAQVLAWIAGDDTGMSSKAIWSHMMGVDPRNGVWGVAHPHDADDFGRCYRLLAIEPAWRARITEMAQYSAEWAALAFAWRQLSEMYEVAASASVTTRGWEKWEPLCDAMRDIVTHSRVCTDCRVVGMPAWTTYPDGSKRCAKCAAIARKKVSA